MGWTFRPVVAVTLGAGLAAAYVWTERRLGDRALTPLTLFGSRPLVALNLLTLLIYGAMGGFLLLLPFVLITAAGYSAMAAGAVMLPFPFIMIVGSPLLGELAGRIGARPLLIAGATLLAAGLLLALRIGTHSNYWTTVLPCICAIALGMTCSAAPLTSAILSSVDAKHTGAASGLNSAVAQLGGGGGHRPGRRGSGDARRRPDRRLPRRGDHRRHRLSGGRGDYRVSVSRRPYPGLGHGARRLECPSLRTTTI